MSKIRINLLSKNKLNGYKKGLKIVMPLTISEEKKMKKKDELCLKNMKGVHLWTKIHTSPSGSNDDEKGGVSETSGEK